MIIQEAQKNIDTITIQGEQVFQRNKFKAIRSKKGAIETQGRHLAEQMLEVYQSVDSTTRLGEILQQKPNKRKKETIADLLKQLDEQIIKLQNTEKEQKANILLNLQNDQTNNLNNIKKIITTLKRQISTAIHKEVKNHLITATTVRAKIKIAQELQDAFSRSSININGPQFSEIIDVIVSKISSNSNTYFSGPHNQKADTITIEITPKNIKTHLEENNYNLNQEIQNEVFKVVSNTFDNFYTDFSNGLKTYQGFSLERGKESWFNAVDRYYKNNITEITKSAESEEELAQKLKILAETIKNTVVITKTMKTFNEYNPEFGFIGGTLGSTIMTQLENIQSLFQSAGVGLNNTELKSLEVLLINCSDATLGASNRDPLEKFLSALATFAIFDEGSAEVTMIANSMINNYVASPKIMHLYKLNGLYYPGSYILERIYENLNKEQTNATKKINNDGVHINANASEKLIGSHNQDSGAERWARVYEQAQNSNVTSIEVSFLSNLVNIINQLIDSFSI